MVEKAITEAHNDPSKNKNNINLDNDNFKHSELVKKCCSIV